MVLSGTVISKQAFPKMETICKLNPLLETIYICKYQTIWCWWQLLFLFLHQLTQFLSVLTLLAQQMITGIHLCVAKIYRAFTSSKDLVVKMSGWGAYISGTIFWHLNKNLIHHYPKAESLISKCRSAAFSTAQGSKALVPRSNQWKPWFRETSYYSKSIQLL